MLLLGSLGVQRREAGINNRGRATVMWPVGYGSTPTLEPTVLGILTRGNRKGINEERKKGRVAGH